MKRKTMLVALLLVLTLAVGAIAIHMHRGNGEFDVSDVSRVKERSIRAPFFPFRTGVLYVRVDGQLEGDATLVILSNHGRDKRTETISGAIRKKIIGGPEEWVDDLSVRFEPGTAKQGHIRIFMACGKQLKDD